MSKILEASCVGGVVTCQGVPIPGANVLSEGVTASTGILLLDEGNASYIAKTTLDLKTALGQVSDALGSITSALTALNALLGPPGILLDIAAITVTKAQITALKEALK